MAKETAAEKQPDLPVQERSKPAGDKISLDEFCARLSETEKRYTLIAGFHSGELMARRLRDTKEEFQKRFSAFIQKPA